MHLNQNSCEFWMFFLRCSPYIFSFGNMLTKNIVGNFISVGTFWGIPVKCCHGRYNQCHGRYTVWVFIPNPPNKVLIFFVNDYIVLNIVITCIFYTWLLDNMVCSFKLWYGPEPAAWGILLTKIDIIFKHGLIAVWTYFTSTNMYVGLSLEYLALFCISFKTINVLFSKY